MNIRITSIKAIAVATLAVVVFMLASAQAQTPASKLTDDRFSNRSEFRFQATKQRLPVRPAGFALMPETSSTSLMPMAAGPNLQVFGSGTLGRLTKWTGFTSSTSAIGDSNIFEDKFGKVGIGTDSPTSSLTVAGMIETTLGGLKFPDGTVQTTAGLASIFRDATLTGNGTSGSPLAVAIPLSLSGSSISPILTVTNNGPGLVLRGVSSAFGKPGVLGTSTNPGGVGVSGETVSNIGVFGAADSGIGVSAQSISGTALKAFSASGGDAVVAESGPSDGDLGGAGVVATGGDNNGRGQGGHGLVATGGDNSINGQGGTGVVVFGGTGSGPGNNGGVAIHAFGGSGVNPAIRGLAGIFVGDVDVTGNLSKASGSFKIDHPLDPENKYLYHSFVESPDMKNIYDGVIRLDANGEAIVAMPEWFSALNRDFRYLLTAIGAPMPGLYIAEELRDNSFRVAGGHPGMKVSWQVTGIRQDAYANKNRIKVEEDKPERERGFYLHPEVFDQHEERGVEWARNPEMMQQLKLRRAKAQQHVHKQKR